MGIQGQWFTPQDFAPDGNGWLEILLAGSQFGPLA
jgi:hypothetical protein